MKVGIIGAGHSGTAAALEASANGAEVTLFSNESFLPYYRPRIASVAFRQAEAAEIVMHQADWYSGNKISLLTNSAVLGIDIGNRSVVDCSGRKHIFDRIIISTGARPVVPAFASEIINKGRGSALWTLSDSLAISNRLPAIRRMIVVGGGVIGIESALRAHDAGLEVCIMEKAPRLMARNLTVKASAYLSNILEAKGIKVNLNANILRIFCDEKSTVMETDNGSIISDFVLFSIGGVPDSSIHGIEHLRSKWGISVNRNLISSSDFVLSAGDSAFVENINAPCSALKAVMQGKVAGVNACRIDSYGSYRPDPVAVEVKYRDFELHCMGSNSEVPGCNEEILSDDGKVFRSLVKQNGTLIGVQMIGANKDFNLYRKQLLEGK